MTSRILQIYESYFCLNCRYTLRNAEYRLCLERNLDIHEGNLEKQAEESSNLDLQGVALESAKTNQCSGENAKFEKVTEDPFDNIGIQGLGEMSPEAEKYIFHLQARLSSVKKVCDSIVGTCP